jgi:hypothetical protein
MTTLRRLLTATVLTVGASALAFGSTVATSSFNGCVGTTCSVTLTATVSGVQFQVAGSSTPTSLFSYQNFGALGINGTLTGVTFDSEFSEVLSSFSVTNNDTNTADGSVSANITIQSTAQIDSSATMVTADAATVCGTFGYAWNGSHPCTPYGGSATTSTAQIASTGFQSIPESTTYIYPGTPVTVTSDVDFGAFGSAPVTLVTGNYTGAGSFLFGIMDTAGYSTVTSGQVGNLNLNTQYNLAYNATADIKYTYTSNSGTPEPTTMLLLGGGLLSLGLLRKRIKS